VDISSETRCICYIPLQLLLPCLSMSASCLTISAQFRVTVYINETVWLTLATQRSKNSPMMWPVCCSYTRRPFLPSLVCLFFSHGISNTRTAKITTKPDTEMFHDESWKLICFAVEGQRSRSRVINTSLAWVFALLWVLAFWGSTSFQWSFHDWFLRTTDCLQVQRCHMLISQCSTVVLTLL